MSKFVSPAPSREGKLQHEPFVELSFPVRGSTLPADHNYALFAALVYREPAIREQSDLSILSIPGFGDKQGKILLTPQSCMRIRVPVSKIPLVYPFAGKRLKLGTHDIQLGIPETHVLTPSKTLQARIVTIKGYIEPQMFIEAVKRQLTRLDITGKVAIPTDRNGNPLRKTIKIQRFTIVGFTTEITDLSDEDSISLQQCGVGGRRHLGCGYFLPRSGGTHG
jgi:CRISPR-associated protein Cas6